MRVSNLINQHELKDFLDCRGVKDNFYRSFVLDGNPDSCSFTLCTFNGFDYMVSHLLGKSQKSGYGLVVTNETLKTERTNRLAIGLIEGDDIICMDLTNGEISLWMIQTGSGEHLVVADSFKEFIEMCCEN